VDSVNNACDRRFLVPSDTSP